MSPLQAKKNVHNEKPLWTLKMVEVTGLEPAAPSSRTMCATKLRYTSK